MQALTSTFTSFRNFNPRQNVYHGYLLVAVICYSLSILVLGLAPWPYNLLLMCVPAFAASQFWFAARNKPLPLDEPYLVRQFCIAQRWWERFSQPISLEQRGDEEFFIRFDWSFAEIYDLNGHQLGVEQIFDQADSDPYWKHGEPREVYTQCTWIQPGCRLGWLALRRSRRQLNQSQD